MKYTEYGLMIPLDELRKMLEYAENRAKYDSMESCIYISGGDKPQIKQYCHYRECNPINHTYGVIQEAGKIMIYENVVSDIDSCVFEPWRMCGEYEDGFSVTVGGNDETDCMQRLIDLQEKHGDLTCYSGYVDQDYVAGEYIGRENFTYD